MRFFTKALILITLPALTAVSSLSAADAAKPAAAPSTSPTAAASPTLPASPSAEFKPLKKGEWKIEVTSSSMAPLTAGIKPKTICVDDKASTWEQRMKEEIAKTKMDCDIKRLAQDAAHISYKVACKGTEASVAHKIPAGATVDGLFNVVRESDTVYILDQDTSAQGILSADDPALAKIPAAQRAALAGLLATQKGGIKIKMKQRYSFVKETCDKDQKTPTKAQ